MTGGPLAITSATDLLQQGLNGVFTGSVYALFAVGYTLVFGVLDILNLAHSAVFMGGAVATLMLMDHGLPFWLATPLGVAACAGLGYLLDRIAFRPLRRRGAPQISALITSIGVALVFVSVSERIFGVASRSFPPDRVPGGQVHAGGLTIADDKLGILVVTLVLMGVLGRSVRSTAWGRAVRAVAENPRAALLMGLDVDRVIVGTLMLSSALGGAAGVMYGLSTGDVSPYIGRDTVELKGLAVIVVGGMGSIGGAVAAGYLLGIIEVFALVAFGTGVRTAVPFVVLLLALVVRPTGLAGVRGARRV